MKGILIVDDKKEVRELLEINLGIEEYRIFQASNGVEAVDLAQSENPDLIIMDVMMPGDLNGIAALKIIKKSNTSKNCKIIILSGMGQDIDKNTGIEAGADAYFVKPFSPLNLIKKVEEFLEY